ncbi:RDD family protein [Rhizobium sp. FKL33]|uniref:RDD family protein n=1 Tax=Rhizobium sp. FKL33 TaxID=2562307 RepID=UPI0010BF7FF7|nr:RDD family protein [Rhizobium sp. FKL33]
MDDAEFPKRHFLRRGAAFLLDCLLASVLAGLVLLPMSILAGVDLGASSVGTKAVCAPAPAELPALKSVETAFPLIEGESRVSTLCVVSILGLQDQTYLTVTNSSGSEGGDAGMTHRFTSSRTITVGVDADGKANMAVAPPSFSIPVAILILAFFISGGKRSPGKWLTSLRVITDDGGALDYKRALRRESLKLLPALGVFAWQAAVWGGAVLSPPEVPGVVAEWTMPSITMMVAGAAFWLFGFVWFFGPFIVWRGKTFHDWLAGTKLVVFGRARA